MAFKRFFFGDSAEGEQAMLKFVDANWDRVLWVLSVTRADADPGMPSGWSVHVKASN